VPAVYESAIFLRRPLMAYAPGKYHTNTVEYSHRNVHHDNENCKDGKRIKREHRINNDDGGKPLCDECKKL
jgi:hypothetical protein